MLHQPPTPDPQAGLAALKNMVRQRTPLAALETFHSHYGNAFQANLPGFSATVLSGADACRFVLSATSETLAWRHETDPIAKLLNQGMLVTDAAAHDEMRRIMTPAFHRKMLSTYSDAMTWATDITLGQWAPTDERDMLNDMRRLTLLALMKALFNIDFSQRIDPLWEPILKSLKYISPGAWLLWTNVPRPGYKKALAQIDTYLYAVIEKRRQQTEQPADLLGLLIDAELSDSLIRDQLLTMLIAGHDTCTALLAWVMLLVADHPDVQNEARATVLQTLGTAAPTIETLKTLPVLDNIVNETMRLYPPVHAGNRFAAQDLTFDGYHIPKGQRVMYSIYLTHRDPQLWPDPLQFRPQRFETKPAAFTFVPFGGGSRICIGYRFAQIEAALVLARVLQNWQLTPVAQKQHLHMGATLEPRPKALVRVTAL